MSMRTDAEWERDQEERRAVRADHEAAVKRIRQENEAVNAQENLPAVIEHPLVASEDAGALMRRATDVAGVCREIVTKTAKKIGGRRYVQVEGWQSIANTFGCSCRTRDVGQTDGGVRAYCDVIRMADGMVVASAEGFVGDDEPTWAKRTMHARRAMAQTRSISRACRSAFAFVVTLIDANLSTTPAEEMPEDDHRPPPREIESTTTTNGHHEPISPAASAARLAQARAQYESAGTLAGVDKVTAEVKANWKLFTKADLEAAALASKEAVKRLTAGDDASRPKFNDNWKPEPPATVGAGKAEDDIPF